MNGGIINFITRLHLVGYFHSVINIPYSECVFIALLIRHSKRMRVSYCHVWPLRSPHAYVNQRLQIQSQLLMMSAVPLETCWAFNERWNNKFYYKISSCWLFPLSHKYSLFWVCLYSLTYPPFKAYARIILSCVASPAIQYFHYFQLSLILRRNERDMIKNLNWYSCKVPVTVARF
jgi:hypothetical protein